MFDNEDKKLRPGDCQGNEVDLSSLARKLSVEEKNFISGLLENDPLGNFYKKGLLVYLIIAIMLLLWPFDFIFFFPKNNTTWIKTSNGIEFLKAGKVISNLPAKLLYDQMLSGSGLSLEIWVAPKTTDQAGPARIISYSLDPGQRNFTLGQAHQNLVMRLRTTKTDINGVSPHMVVGDVFSSTNRLHIAITYDFSIQRVYINGQLRVEGPIPGGNFCNWDPSCYLVLGNEVTADRPWLGKLFYVSIYNRALEPHEISHNYLAGALRKPNSQKKTDLVSSGLVVRYFFGKHTGSEIYDSSRNVLPLNLHIPEKLKIREKRFLSFSFLQFMNMEDTPLNILVFIPFGFLLLGTLQQKRCSLLSTFFVVLISGMLFSTLIESVQYFSETRFTSLNDIVTNTLGTLLGIVLFSYWKKRLQFQSKGLWCRKRIDSR